MSAMINSQSYTALPAPMTLLSQAWPEVSMAAHEVGIDIDAMRHEFPAPGTMLKGSHVPVLHRSYRHSCSVLLHINRLSGGDWWPFLRFSTFKHGGVQRDFNGLRWWREFGNRFTSDRVALMHQRVGVEAAARAAANRQREDAQRLARFQRWDQRWHLADSVGADNAWLTRRLIRQVDTRLLDRFALRYWPTPEGQTLMALLEDASHALRGYQLITTAPLTSGSDTKRLYLPHAGASVGSFIRLHKSSSVADSERLPVAICEGLATGLSLALEWPGEIRVALNAGNLAAARQSVTGPVVFFCDEDVWKPHAGNVGRNKAALAMQPGDVLHGPRFRPRSMASQPTDYNDLLQLEGREALGQQVGLAWQLWQ